MDVDADDAAAEGGRVGSVTRTLEAEGAPSGSVATNLRSLSVVVANGLLYTSLISCAYLLKKIEIVMDSLVMGSSSGEGTRLRAGHGG